MTHCKIILEYRARREAVLASATLPSSSKSRERFVQDHHALLSLELPFEGMALKEIEEKEKKAAKNNKKGPY